MTKGAVAIAILLAAATPSLAGTLLPASSRYALAATLPADQIPALCDEIIAHQNDNPVAMGDAARLLFHGMLMGDKCVKSDKAKALDLLRKAGDRTTFNTFLRILQEKAAAGNAAAISALAKADTSPF